MFRSVLLFLLLSSIGYAQDHPMRVLFIGNSYTHMNNLYKIFQNLSHSKGKNIHADTLAVSGSTLRGHTERPNTFRKIKSKQWDYVFIQGFSRELSYDSVKISTETVPYAKQLIDSIKTYNSCVNIYYYMTWGYADGYKDSIPDDTYNSMQERIQRGYFQLSHETGNYPIAPVGMVWKNIREAYPLMNLYASDNAHPSILGSYVAACTFYAAIFKDSPLNADYPKKIEEEQAKIIQKKAADYVLNNYEMYHLDTAQVLPSEKEPEVAFDIREKWLSITLVNKSKEGDHFYWDFGDGNSSSKRQPKYYYKKPGKYLVSMFVQSDCNWYKLSQSVKVSDKVKHANSPKP